MWRGHNHPHSPLELCPCRTPSSERPSSCEEPATPGGSVARSSGQRVMAGAPPSPLRPGPNLAAVGAAWLSTSPPHPTRVMQHACAC